MAMPVESITCQACGSPDVVELKPNRFVCSHCDAVRDRVTSALVSAITR
jgi:hypothetical protein